MCTSARAAACTSMILILWRSSTSQRMSWRHGTAREACTQAPSVGRAQEPNPRSCLLNLTVCTRNVAVWAWWFSCRSQTRLSESPTVGQGICLQPQSPAGSPTFSFTYFKHALLQFYLCSLSIGDGGKYRKVGWPKLNRASPSRPRIASDHIPFIL